MGKRPFELYVPPEDRAMDQARLTRDLAMIRENREAMRQLEMPLQRKDGALLEAMIVGCGIHDSNGKLIGLSTIIRDVTERRRVERESAALAAIVESSDDAISRTAPDLQTPPGTAAPRECSASLRRKRSGSRSRCTLPPDATAASAGNRRAAGGATGRGGSLRRSQSAEKTATLVQVSTVCFAIRDREGKVVGVSAIQRDITERIRAERKAALLAAIVNASQDAIMNVSPEARILFWNPAAEKAYGYSAEEAIGKGIELFVPPDELAETIARTRQRR